MCVCIPQHKWERSEASPLEKVQSFHLVGPRDQTQVIRLESKALLFAETSRCLLKNSKDKLPPAA